MGCSLGQGMPGRGRTARSLRSALERSDRKVVAEVARSPCARLIVRRRVVGQKAFESAARRARPGGFGVAALVRDPRDRVLLVRFPPGQGWTRDWVVPGGGGEPGESPREAVRREVREEAGIEVGCLALWKVFHEVVVGRRGGRVEWDFLQYTAGWKRGEPITRVPQEIGDVRWFPRLPTRTAFRKDWLRAPRSLEGRREGPISRRAGASARGRGRARRSSG